MPLLILAACSGGNDRAAPSTGAAAKDPQPEAPVPAHAAMADAATPDAVVDASPWRAGERPVERSAANDSPKMCMDPGVCTSLCEQGDGAGCYWLGVMHSTKSDVDMGVPYDPDKAIAQFLLACDLGITLGCNGAAQIFRVGSYDKPVDLPRAQRLFQKACDLGHEPACRYAKSLPKK